MTKNIEERTLAATATLESSAKTVDELAHTDNDIETPVGKRKSMPKLSREFEEDNQRREIEHVSAQNHRDQQFQYRFSSTQGVTVWAPGIQVTDSFQRFSLKPEGDPDYKEYLPNPKKVPFETSATFEADLLEQRWLENSIASKDLANEIGNQLSKQGFGKTTYPKELYQYCVIGDPVLGVIPSGVNALRLLVGAEIKLFSLSAKVDLGGPLTEIDIAYRYVVINNIRYSMGPYDETSKQPRKDIREFGVIFDGETDSYEGLRQAALSGERIYIPYQPKPAMTSKAFLEPTDEVSRFDWEMANGAEIKHIGDFMDSTGDWRSSSMIRPGPNCLVFRLQIGKLTGNWDGITDPYTIPTSGIGVWLSDYPHIPEVWGGECSYFTDYGCYSNQDRVFWHGTYICHHNGFQGFAVTNSGNFTEIDTVIAHDNTLMGFDAELTKGRSRPMKGINVKKLICYNNGEHDIAVTTGSATAAEMLALGFDQSDYTFNCESIECLSDNVRPNHSSNVLFDFPNYTVGKCVLRGDYEYNLFHRNAYGRLGGEVIDVDDVDAKGGKSNVYLTGDESNKDSLIHFGKIKGKSDHSYNFYVDPKAFAEEIRLDNFFPSGSAEPSNYYYAFVDKKVLINGMPTLNNVSLLNQCSSLYDLSEKDDLTIRVPKGCVIDEVLIDVTEVPEANKVLFIYVNAAQVIRINTGLGLRVIKPEANVTVGSDVSISTMGFAYSSEWGGGVRVRHVDDAGEATRLKGKVLVKYSA